MTFRILTLDGGGIRGVLSATLLMEVEKVVKQKTGKELYEYFDLIAGTSTGSILAAGIACKMKAEEMRDLYLECGEDIFLKSVRQQRKWRWLSQAFGGHALYPHERGEKGLSKVLQKRLIHRDLNKCPKISEINNPRLLILAYDVFSRNTTWFTNNPPSENPSWYDNIDLWKICTASASAPTFFPPCQLPYFNSDESYPHIDGGVSANNPELSAIAHALLLEKNNNLKLDDIALLSIGTGNTTRPYTYEEVKKWGLLGWVSHLPDIFMNPAAQNSEPICGQIIESVRGGEKRYLRLNFDLNKRFIGKSTPEKLRTLEVNPYNEFIFQKTGEKKKISEPVKNSPLSA
jgi:patatin-like phospholipase/acyl hydrolase